MCSFQGQTLFWTFLRNGWSDWCETKRKYIGWMLGIICDLDHRPHSWPWPWIFQGLISKLLYLGNCWSVKWKGSELIGYWADYMTLPFDHTHDLDLAVSRSESEITLSQEWHGRLTWNERMGVIHSWPWSWLVWPWWGGRMYRIETGVTSDVGVWSTYLVCCLI